MCSFCLEGCSNKKDVRKYYLWVCSLPGSDECYHGPEENERGTHGNEQVEGVCVFVCESVCIRTYIHDLISLITLVGFSPGFYEGYHRTFAVHWVQLPNY